MLLLIAHAPFETCILQAVKTGVGANATDRRREAADLLEAARGAQSLGRTRDLDEDGIGINE